jgi:tryptophan synthase beta chain
MTQSSYRDKPYRRTMMELAGAQVHCSPSTLTGRGRELLDADPNHAGSLGIGMGEAVEYARTKPGYRLALGCMAYHAALHQSVIGIETERQFQLAGAEPDILIGCVGGGSNLVGFAAPYLERKLRGDRRVRVIAAESANAPALTRGELRYDFADAFGYTQKFLMYTLGHEFVPPRIHAGGLRYHGKATILSLLAARGLVESVDITQESAFAAGRLFYQAEGILPAPESGHAIAAVMDAVKESQAAGQKPTICFCLSGTGYLDLKGYASQFHLSAGLE